MQDEKTREFLDLYNHLESVLRQQHKIPGHEGPIAWVLRNDRRRFARMSEELEYCRQVRNLYQHNERIDGSYAVIPSDAMIGTLRRTIEKIENPARAWDVCVKAQEVYSAQLEDLMRPAMRTMAERSFTHVPILRDGRVVGAFSENTLLSFMMRDAIVIIEEDCTFEEIGDLLPLDAHVSETFAFVPKDMLATDLAGMFEESMRKQERLGMVFVTESGSRQQRLLGIATAWVWPSSFRNGPDVLRPLPRTRGFAQAALRRMESAGGPCTQYAPCPCLR